MAEHQRRVIASTVAHARALTDNLADQGYRVVSVQPTAWELRRTRRRRTEVVTVVVQTPPPPPPWGPPSNPAG